VETPPLLLRVCVPTLPDLSPHAQLQTRYPESLPPLIPCMFIPGGPVFSFTRSPPVTEKTPHPDLRVWRPLPTFSCSSGHTFCHFPLPVSSPVLPMGLWRSTLFPPGIAHYSCSLSWYFLFMLPKGDGSFVSRVPLQLLQSRLGCGGRTLYTNKHSTTLAVSRAPTVSRWIFFPPFSAER